MQTHKEWLDNEYQQWVAALQESTVRNFKEHPMVRRMLSLDMDFPREYRPNLDLDELQMMEMIDRIGRDSMGITDACWRMIYYAEKIVKLDPPSIVEIGAGVGQFYAVLRALGWKGRYFIFDLDEVKEFQSQYLAEAEKLTGLSMEFFQYPASYDFCVSFYALGEFDEEMKKRYVDNVVTKCAHGLVLWNPHSGASIAIPWPCQIKDEEPLTSPGNKELTW